MNVRKPMFESPHANPTCGSLQDVPKQFRGVVVIIPARNEEASLPLVLRDLPPVGQVIVVDNSSTDGTALCAQRLGAHVVQEVRLGYGSACLAGLAEIQRASSSGHRPVPDVVVFLDADYSDHPELLPQLVAPILADECDFVLGSRLCGQREPGAMPLQSILGNRLACFLMKLIWGGPLHGSRSISGNTVRCTARSRYG